MKYFLITEDHNYADEFSFDSFIVVECESRTFLDSKIRKALEKEFSDKNKFFGSEVYFGSNEYIEFEDINDMIASLNIREIKKEEYDVIINVLGGSFGMAVLLDRIYLDDEEDIEYDIS